LLSVCYNGTIVQIVGWLLASQDLYFEYFYFKLSGKTMNYSLQKFFIFITIAVSLAVITSPSYAKDEGDEKSKTTEVKKVKEVEKEKYSKQGEKKAKPVPSGKSEKGSDSDNSRPDKSGKKSAGSKGKVDKPKDKGGKSDDSGSNTKSGKKKASNSGRKTGSISNAKKQYKDIIVNLNKADAKTFSHYLVGIGEKRAKAIIAYRKKNGKFKDIKELLKIEGIGDKIFDGLKKNISLTKGETSVLKGNDQSDGKKTKK
jgi:competence protein ComEA